jgi:DNA helicase-2/ATP-dependent DNA helicase PcrA
MSSNKTKYAQAAKEFESNRRQLAAYDSKGHCVVLAGPGSGKTKVLTTKLARMLAEDVKAPRGIACITYSNQCAKELKKRLGALLVEQSARVFIGTMHSFCLREVIIPYGKLAGLSLPQPLKVASVSKQNSYFTEAFSRIHPDQNPRYRKTQFDEFRRIVLDRKSADWINNNDNMPVILEYERLLFQAGEIDFDAMSLYGLKLIQENEWVRKALKAKYPILAIDEYQDLGVPLHDMVSYLCLEGGIRLFAVGDPDQSIYGFTGARPALMNELADVEDVEQVRLRLNYRSGRSIINASTAALAETRDFEASNDKEGVVIDHKCIGGLDEQISLAINNLVPEALARKEGRRLGDIGVLYLDRHGGAAVAHAADQAGLEYVRFDQGNPYPRTPATGWLEECASWCAGGWKDGEPRLSNLLWQWRNFFPQISKETEIRQLRRGLVSFLYSNRDPDTRLRDWIKAFADAGLFTMIRAEPTMADEVESIRALYEVCKDDQPLAAYSVANFGGQYVSQDRLNLTTIHSSKGLEYDVVIMLDLEAGRIPRYNASELQIKESRRLFYVAMTRARHEVHLLWSGWYESAGGRVFRNGRSSFVDEVMQEMGRQMLD